MLNRCWVFLFVLVVGYLYSTVTCALVYRCTTASGLLEFRDKPCQTSVEKGVVVPYRDQTSGVVLAVAKVDEHASKTNQTQDIIERKRVRKEAQVKKNAEKEMLKTKRREARCLQTQEKIKKIQSHLRAGCKLRRCNRLQEQLRHFEMMQNRYCTPVPKE